MKCIFLFFSTLLAVSTTQCTKNAADKLPTDKIWNLSELDGKGVPANVKATIQFDSAKKSYGGNDSCNTYGGLYELNEGSLKLGPAMATKMFCQDVAEWETAFLQMLEKVNGFRHRDGALTLLSGDQVLAVFK